MIGLGFFAGSCISFSPILLRRNILREILRELLERGSNTDFASIDTVKLSDGVIAEPLRLIPRNDSEFSLGLNRSESFENLATTLGPMCSTGQGLWLAGDYLLRGFVFIMIGKALLDLSGTQSK